MGTASLPFDAESAVRKKVWSLGWREFWRKLAPACGHSDCRHTQSVWRRLRRRPGGVLIQSVRYCRDDCAERALTDALLRIRSASQRALASHRVPLGLLLLSRQQLTVEQLRAALAAQRTAGRGRIGEWLLTLGFVSEQQVTAALARQWSCPVLRANSLASASFKLAALKPGASRAPQIPLTLLESFVMIPVDYVETTATLHIAFGEGVDNSILYAIEQMLGCHTESCMAVPSYVRQHLQTLSGRRAESEVVFDRVTDGAESARIILSYCARLAASEVRLAACGPHLWVRLLRPSRPAMDLLLRAPRDDSAPASFSHASAALTAV
jgi:hypothetical protein